MEAMCGVASEVIASPSAYAVLANLPARLEALAYHPGRNRSGIVPARHSRSLRFGAESMLESSVYSSPEN